MSKDNINKTLAPVYGGDMPMNMKIDALEDKLKLVYPELTWEERLVEARRILKGDDNGCY